MARRPVVPRTVDKVRISGFKSIVDQTIELGRFNVFVGENGCGKTAILEAIGVLGAAVDGRVSDRDLLDRGVRPGVPQLFKSAFAHGRIPRGIMLSAESSHQAGYTVLLDNPQDSAATPWTFMTESLTEGGQKLATRSPRGGNFWNGGVKVRLEELDPVSGIARRLPSRLPIDIRILQQQLAGFVIYDPQTAILSGQQSESAQRDPLGLHGGRLAAAVRSITDSQADERPLGDLCLLVPWIAEAATEALSSDLVSPSVSALSEIVRFTDKYLRDGRNKLSAYDASEGALYVLFCLALFAHPRSPSFFAIENVDHALHPRLARALVRKLSEASLPTRRQVLLTTHNPLVLDGLALSDDSIRLFTVDRSNRGHTVVERVEYTDAIMKAEQSGLTLSQMWTQGILGGVPDLW